MLLNMPPPRPPRVEVATIYVKRPGTHDSAVFENVTSWKIDQTGTLLIWIAGIGCAKAYANGHWISVDQPDRAI